MDTPKYDGMGLVAELHLVTVNGTDSTVSVYTSQREERPEDARARVILRVWTHPDNYEQHWSYEGSNARVAAMNKATSEMGWGDLALYDALVKDGEL